MDFVSEIALRALASATTPHDAEHAAAACERRAGDIGPGSPQHARNKAAAVLLRELATSAPRTPRHLTITCTGLPVRLDPTRIDPDKHVVSDHLDVDSGEAAARLFMDAVDAGAIVDPAGVTIECYGDDDTDGGGFVLVVFGDGHSGRGVTCGWRDVKNISGKTPEGALEFMVAELNAALGVPTLPSGKLARVAVAAKELPVREALRQIVAGDPRSVVAEVSGAPVSEVANLAGQDIDLLVLEAGARSGGYTMEDLDVLAETFPRTPILVIATPGAPGRDMIRPFATGGILPLSDVTTQSLRDAIADASGRPQAVDGSETAGGEQ